MASVEDRFVFDGGCDEVFQSAGAGIHHSKNSVIVRLRAPAGEDDLLRARVQETGDLFTGSLDARTGALPKGMDGRGVAKSAGEKGKHGIEDGRVDGSCGVMVEVDAVHGSGTNRIRARGERGNRGLGGIGTGVISEPWGASSEILAGASAEPVKRTAGCGTWEDTAGSLRGIRVSWRRQQIRKQPDNRRTCHWP